MFWQKVLFRLLFPLRLQALSNLKQEREHIKAELQNMIEENSKENMDMALVRTEVLMKKRDRLMAQRIREDNERTSGF